MWKKLALMILVLTLISVFTIPSAEAESRAHRVLKALALGGLFAALPPPPPVLISPTPERHYYPLRQEYFPGHREMSREWIPETWERIWIPAHYDRWGNWVPGYYENRQVPGYYEERRVWVEGYYRPY